MIHKGRDGVERIIKAKTDSQRAVKWKPLAEKTYRQMESMGLSKKMNIQGFMIHAEAIVSHECGVKSPAGLVVLCSTENGVFAAEYDSVYGTVTKENYKMFVSSYLMSYFSNTGQGFGLDEKITIEINKKSEEDILENYNGYFKQYQAVYARQGSLYNLDPGDPLGNPHYYIFPDDWPSPCVIPSLAESMFVCISGVDNLPNEGSDYVYDGITSQEISRIIYNSDNKKTESRTTIVEQMLDNPNYRPPVFIQPVSIDDQFKYVVPVTGVYYPFDSGRRYFATIFSKNESGDFEHKRIYLDDSLTGKIDDQYVLSCILNNTNCVCRPSGTFVSCNGKDVFKILHLINLSGSTYYNGQQGTPSPTYWDDNPQSKKYRLILVVYDCNSEQSSVINSSQFIDLLDNKTVNIDVINNVNVRYDYAYYVLAQLFSRPNHNYTVPYDTSMFSDSSGNIYTWARFYGKFKFNETGLHEADFTVPEYVIDNEGVRPSIYFSGKDFELNDSFVCICERIEEPREVFKIYFGSPFDREDYEHWLEIPIPPIEMGRLLHVRPVGYAAGLEEEKIAFIGVLRYVEIVDEQEIVRFAPAIINYSDARVENTWRRLPPMTFDASDSYENPPPGWYGSDPPEPPEERACWSVSLYGDSPETAAMMRYPTHPAAMPQTPCGPYDGYKRGLP